MDKEVLVKVSGVSKKFARDLKKSLRYGLQDISREMLGKARKTELRSSEFWAVSNIDFELRRGECLGLIGHNGAGKSTLLKMLNGLIKPDKGTIEIRGRVAALIELGAGFNPILTGRENIYNNASVLGFTKEETDAKLDEIIEFSELGEFIDAPVQSYSSGMKVRLGFAVAAQMDPDVLIIDEVLAVGDVGFRTKCFMKIGELLPNTCIILVSHAMPMVGRYSNRVILMDKGRCKVDSTDVSTAIESYYDLFPNREKGKILEGAVRLKELCVNNAETILGGSNEISYGDRLTLEFLLSSSKIGERISVRITIVNSEGLVIAVSKSDIVEMSSDEVRVRMELPEIHIKSGEYNLSVSVRDQSDLHNVSYYTNYCKFRIVGGYNDFGAAYVAYPNECTVI